MGWMNAFRTTAQVKLLPGSRRRRLAGAPIRRDVEREETVPSTKQAAPEDEIRRRQISLAVRYVAAVRGR
jgi:hypothetical protein